MDDKGFIVIYRSMKTWEWYQDTNTKVVFLHLLLNANWESGNFKGHVIPRGSLVVGRKKLAKELGLSEQSIRTALDHLKSTNEITIKTTNKFSIVTIVNWEKYQDKDEEITNKTANEQPTINQQLTTIEQYNNITNKQIKEKSTKKESPQRKIIPPQIEWVREYCKSRNNNVDPDKFFDFYESKGWKVGKERMKDWEAAIRTWEKDNRSKGFNGLTDTQAYAKEHGHQSSSNPDFIDKLENETREKSKNPYKNYIHGNYDFEQLERELREK